MTIANDFLTSLEADLKAGNRFRAHFPLLASVACFFAIAATLAIGSANFSGLVFATNHTLAVSLCFGIANCVLLVLFMNRKLTWHMRYGILICFSLIFLYWKPTLSAMITADIGGTAITTTDLGHHINCWAIGFSISMSLLSLCYWIQYRLRLSPSIATRVSSIAIAGLGSLLAQVFFCPFLNLEHVNVAHFGQFIIAATSTLFIDKWMLNSWLKSKNYTH